MSLSSLTSSLLMMLHCELDRIHTDNHCEVGASRQRRECFFIATQASYIYLIFCSERKHGQTRTNAGTINATSLGWTLVFSSVMTQKTINQEEAYSVYSSKSLLSKDTQHTPTSACPLPVWAQLYALLQYVVSRTWVTFWYCQ